MTQLTSRRRLHYGWIVMAVAGPLAVAAGFASLSIKPRQRPVLLAAA